MYRLLDHRDFFLPRVGFPFPSRTLSRRRVRDPFESFFSPSPFMDIDEAFSDFWTDFETLPSHLLQVKRLELPQPQSPTTDSAEEHEEAASNAEDEVEAEPAPALTLAEQKELEEICPESSLPAKQDKPERKEREQKQQPKQTETFHAADAAVIATPGPAPAAFSSSASSASASQDLIQAHNDSTSWLQGFFNTPELQVSAKDQEVLVTVALPGARKEDVKVNIREDQHGRKILCVSGKRQDESTEEDQARGFFSTRRVSGSFSRSLVLPEGTVFEGVKATHENGVLSISVPRVAEQPKPSTMEVDVE